MRHISDIIPENIKKSGTSPQIEATKVLDLFLQHAKEMWGEEVEQDMKPLYVKNQTLTVAVTTASLAQELKLREKEIIDFLHQKMGKKIVERLRYLV